MKFSVCLLAGALAVGRAAACDLCAIYNVSAAQGTHDHGIFAGVAQQFTYFSTLQNDGEKIHDRANQRMESSITQLIGGYNFSDWFGAQINVPIIYRSFRRAEEFRIDNGTESGLGDVSLTLNAVPFRREKLHSTVLWTVLAGAKFPTGDSDRLGEELAEDHHHDDGEEGHPPSGVHGHDLALGSGSVDAIVGTGVFARYERVFFSGSIQYAIRTEGDFDYRYANDLIWNGGPGMFILLSEEHTLALQFMLSGEEKGMDHLHSNRADDTAMTSVFAGPQLNYTWSDKLSVQAGVDFPLLLDNSAIQLVPDWRMRGALSWRF
jgi:hypothetical protein